MVDTYVYSRSNKNLGPSKRGPRYLRNFELPQFLYCDPSYNWILNAGHTSIQNCNYRTTTMLRLSIVVFLAFVISLFNAQDALCGCFHVKRKRIGASSYSILSCPNKNLTQVPDASRWDCGFPTSDVKHMNLNGNQITSLEDTGNMMLQMVILDISDNLLTNTDFITSDHFPALEILDLHNNPIPESRSSMKNFPASIAILDVGSLQIASTLDIGDLKLMNLSSLTLRKSVVYGDLCELPLIETLSLHSTNTKNLTMDCELSNLISVSFLGANQVFNSSMLTFPNVFEIKVFESPAAIDDIFSMASSFPRINSVSSDSLSMESLTCVGFPLSSMIANNQVSFTSTQNFKFPVQKYSSCVTATPTIPVAQSLLTPSPSGSYLRSETEVTTSGIATVCIGSFLVCIGALAAFVTYRHRTASIEKQMIDTSALANSRQGNPSEENRKLKFPRFQFQKT